MDSIVVDDGIDVHLACDVLALCSEEVEVVVNESPDNAFTRRTIQRLDA
jgi:hypothetical protein